MADLLPHFPRSHRFPPFSLSEKISQNFPEKICSSSIPLTFNPLPCPLHKPLSRLHMYPHLSSFISHFPDLHPSPMAAACLHHNPPPLSCDPNTDPHLKILKFCQPISPIPQSTDSPVPGADLWSKLRAEARADVDHEPILANHYITSILSYNSMDRALANHLAVKLCNSTLSSSTLFDVFAEVVAADRGEILGFAIRDLEAVKERDPAWISYVQCFLNYKGFLAIQSHRIAHKLWNRGRKVLALLIQNRVAEAFAVDIHPGARIGCGILLDHATGVVVGETAVIGNDVSILHHVTLGGTGKDSGDRHPKIGDGVLIGAGTCILGNIKIGDGAKIGAGSVVLKDVPPRTTAVGNPARLIGGKENPIKLDKMPSFTMDHTSHISDWSDYVI